MSQDITLSGLGVFSQNLSSCIEPYSSQELKVILSRKSPSKELGVPYSKLVNSLLKKNILLDRKILSDLAISDNQTFKKVVKTAIS